MNMENILDILGGDPKRVMARFGGNEGLWLRFAAKFKEDTTYQQLLVSVQSNDSNGIEMHAHTLKGVAANLGFDNLSQAAASVVKEARSGGFEKIPELFAEVSIEYEKVLECIIKLEQ